MSELKGTRTWSVRKKAKEGEWLPGWKRGSSNPFQSTKSYLTNRTGWKREGGKWVHYRKGKPTGKVKKYASETTLMGRTLNTVGRRVKNAPKRWLKRGKKLLKSYYELIFLKVNRQH